jgi:phage terminase small subunit
MAIKLTKKEKGFVHDYLKTGNGTKAALKNYNTTDENTAAAIASENLRKPKIENYIASLLPDDLLAEKHLALLNKEDENGNIDVMAVKAGLDMGYKIKGSYAPEKKSLKVEDITEIRNKDDAELAKLAGLES